MFVRIQNDNMVIHFICDWNTYLFSTGKLFLSLFMFFVLIISSWFSWRFPIIVLEYRVESFKKKWYFCEGYGTIRFIKSYETRDF